MKGNLTDIETDTNKTLQIQTKNMQGKLVGAMGHRGPENSVERFRLR